MVAARFPLGWTGSFIPLSKKFTLLAGHSYLQPLWKFLKQIENVQWYENSATPLPAFLFSPHTNS
jgi:hypothetical protein